MIRHQAANQLVHAAKSQLPILADRLFPERQFFLRSRGRVRFLAVSQRAQLLVAGMLVVGAIGGAVTALLPSTADDVVAAKNREIDRLAAAYRRIDAKLADATGKRDSALRAKDRLSERAKSLTAAVTRSNREQTEIGKRLATARRQFVKTRDALKLATIKTQALAVKSAELDRRLTRTDADRTRAQDELALMRRQLTAALAEQVATEREISQLSQLVADFGGELTVAGGGQPDANRDAAGRDAIRLATRVTGLQDLVNSFRDRQLELVDWLYRQAADDTARAVQSLAITGLDIDELAREAGDTPYGQGGPLVQVGRIEAAGDGDGIAGGSFVQSIIRLEATLTQWHGLRKLIRRMPLGQPTDRGWVSSNFGKRRDPFSRRWARHAGLDISAPRGTPIYATAPGRVISAGRSGPYGNAVVIDHGMGFKTRYAHLRKILVKRNQDVSYRDRIGLMGSTGRSSGTHVHYEVIYRGEHRNPAKFIEAGNFVFREDARGRTAAPSDS